MAAQGYTGPNRDRVQRVSDVLRNPRRRRVLQELAALPDDVSFETLVDRMLSRESVDREDLASDLHHIHLPKLADIGVITYDADERAVCHHECRVVDVLALVGEAFEGGQ